MVGSTKKLMMHALANIEFKRIVNRGGAIVMHARSLKISSLPRC